MGATAPRPEETATVKDNLLAGALRCPDCKVEVEMVAAGDDARTPRNIPPLPPPLVELDLDVDPGERVGGAVVDAETTDGVVVVAAVDAGTDVLPEEVPGRTVLVPDDVPGLVGMNAPTTAASLQSSMTESLLD